MASFWCFYCWLGPQSTYHIVFLLLTLNKYLSVGWERQVIMFWKHKKRYICFICFIQWFIIAQNWDNYEHNINLCFSSKFPLGIPSVLSLLRPVIWSTLSSLFRRSLIFFAVANRKPIEIIEAEKINSRYLIRYAESVLWLRL